MKKKRFEVSYELPPLRGMLKRDVMAVSKENAKSVLKEQLQLPSAVKIRDVVEI